MCQDDISSHAKNWLEKKITTITKDALEFNTDLLLKQRFEKQFNHVLKDHQTIYTQSILNETSIRSPFRDLRAIETQNISEKQDITEKVIFRATTPQTTNSSSINPKSINKNVSEVEKWIYNWLEKEAGIERNQFTPFTSFSEYGLDSSLSIRFISDINAHYKIHVEPSIIWSYSTVNELATYLCEFEIKSSEKTAINDNGLDDDFLKGLLNDEIQP